MPSTTTARRAALCLLRVVAAFFALDDASAFIPVTSWHLKSHFFALDNASAFIPVASLHVKSQGSTGVSAAKKADGADGGGYKFGDVTRGLASRFTKRVERMTGKEYQLGDLSRHLDAKAKEKICEVTGKDDYRFGDLSLWADANVKAKVCEMTGKAEYTAGDITKEILRRVTSGEMKWEEVLMLMKMMLSIGASFSPVAGMLPAKVLIELLNYSIIAQAGEMVTSAISTELDRRMKKAFTGDPEYQLGVITKRQLLNFIGSDTYEFGSLTRTIIEKMNTGVGDDNDESAKVSRSGTGKGDGILFADSSDENLELSNEQVLMELAAWDKAFQVEAKGK